MRSRILVWPLVAGLAVSIAATAALWVWLGPGALAGLLVLPFIIPFMGKRRNDEEAPSTCPKCGWNTREPRDRFCPRDGEELKPGRPRSPNAL